MFSMMNYYLPLKGMASMHCSANTDMNGENTALFFGLSGTGKTTLSTDPKRLLIGDDEHGWDDNGVFNFEGGCYAKVINLDKDSEPDIYNAIKRNALLENVTVDENGKMRLRRRVRHREHPRFLSHRPHREDRATRVLPHPTPRM